MRRVETSTTSRGLVSALLALALGAGLITACTRGGTGTNTPTGGGTGTEAAWILTSKTERYEGDAPYTTEETYTLDGHGNRLGSVLDNGSGDVLRRSYELDEDGYVTQVSTQAGDAEADVVGCQIEKDDEGRPLRIVDDRGGEKTFSYDDGGRLAQVVQRVASEDGGTQLTTTSFDADGNVTSVREDRDGLVILSTYVYTYDDQGNVMGAVSTSGVEGDDGASDAVVSYSYEYDDHGNLARQTLVGLTGETVTTYEYTQITDPSRGATFYAQPIYRETGTLL